MAEHSAPDYAVDQRINWRGIEAAFQTSYGIGLPASQVQNPLANSDFAIFSKALAAAVQTAEAVTFECPQSVPYLVSCGGNSHS